MIQEEKEYLEGEDLNGKNIGINAEDKECVRIWAGLIWLRKIVLFRFYRLNTVVDNQKASPCILIGLHNVLK
jgi:hypothetical protein